MKRNGLLYLVFSLLFAAIMGFPSMAADLDTTADLVLGQYDFTSNTSNAGIGFVNSAGVNLPLGVAVDRSSIPNRIYVSDSSNNRILGWKSEDSLYNGVTADLVIGQPNFSANLCNQGSSITASTLCAPEHLAVDSAGNLYVADRGNSRILVYFKPNFNLPPDPPGPPGTVGDTVADLVIGQPNLTSGGCSNPSPNTASASSLCAPIGVAVDGAGNLYVADMANNRVLEYNAPLATNAAANRVFGQSSFTTTFSGAGQSGLNQPNDVSVDSGGNMYVADFRNNRVLEYDNPLGSCSTCDTTPDRVFGQPNFNSTLANRGSTTPSASSLYNPAGVAVDNPEHSAGNLYVEDRTNRRVLEYDNPLGSCPTCDTVADRVFGQKDFTKAQCNSGGISAKTLCMPTDVDVDRIGNVWVTDYANNRVLEYNNPVPDTVPPQPPTNLGNTPDNGSVTLTWTPSVSGDIVHQRLKRSLTSGGPYTVIATFDNNTTNTYVDTGLTNGTPYYYVVTALDTGNESANSNEDISTPQCTLPPAAPTNLTNTPGDGTVTLNWTPSASPNVIQQRVYRSLASGSGYTLIATFNDNTTNTYVDTGLANGTTYYYVVTATNSCNIESLDSNEDVSTPQPAGFVPIANIHFEEVGAEDGPNQCPIENIVEFSFENPPGTPSASGHDTNDIHPPSVVATMTFPDSFTTTFGPESGKKETHEHPHALGYVKEYEVRFDCDVMTAHVGLNQNVTINITGAFNGPAGGTFGGSAVIQTHN